MTVSAVVVADLDALVPLFAGYLQFYQVPRPAGEIHAFLYERLQRGDAQLFIARDEQGMAQGFTQLYPSFSSVSLARIFVLNDLFVHECARRKGVASKLLSAATEFAQALGAVRVSLSTAVSNESAQAVYQAAGWTRDQQFLVYHFPISR